MRAPRALEENRWKTNRKFVLVTRDMDVASERQRFSEAEKVNANRIFFHYEEYYDLATNLRISSLKLFIDIDKFI